MRSVHRGILLVTGFIAWMAIMYFGPTYKADDSVFLFAGIFIFGFVLMFWLVAEITNRGAPGTSFPGFRTTINPTEAFATVSLPGVEEDDALANLKCFALGGNPLMLTKGGGPDNGYLVCPNDCVEKWDGDPSQFWFNCDLQPYRISPRKGEHPMSELPRDVKLAVMRHGKFTKKCVVMYGIYKHQTRGLGSGEMKRDVEAQMSFQNSRIETLEAVIKSYKSQLISGRDKDLYGRYPKEGFMKEVMPNERR